MCRRNIQEVERVQKGQSRLIGIALEDDLQLQCGLSEQYGNHYCRMLQELFPEGGQIDRK